MLGRPPKHLKQAKVRLWVRNQMVSFVCASLVLFCMTRLLENLYATVLDPAIQTLFRIDKVNKKCADEVTAGKTGKDLSLVCRNRRFSIQWLKFGAALAETAVVLVGAYYVSKALGTDPTDASDSTASGEPGFK